VETTDLGNDGSVESVADSLIDTPQEEIIQEDYQKEATEDEDHDVADEPEESDDSQDEPEESDDSEDVDDSEEYDSHDEDILTVKVNGEEVEVTLEDLKRSYSGQKYIQQGMQQAAEQRKEVEAQYGQLQQAQQQLQQVLQAAQSGQLNLTPPTPPSRELFEQDPIGFMDEKLRYEEDLQSFQQNQQMLKQTMEQQEQINQQALQQTVQREMEALTQVDPDFADPVKAGEVKEKMLNFARNVGFSDEDIKGITDHRALLVLKKAALYDEMKANKPKALEKAKKARPYVKSGAKKSQTSRSKKAAQAKADRMKQTGSVDDVANFLIG